MPIGPKGLLRLVRERKLVENLSDRETQNPEGAGFDLRVGEIYEIEGPGFLGIEERKTPGNKLLAKYTENSSSSFKFELGKYYLVTTIEEVNVPAELAGYTSPRTTLFRSGLNLLCSPVQPGYRGKLTFEIINLGPSMIEIELGARIVHIQFEVVDGGGIAYRGQWQNGRIAATKKEKQV